MFRTSNPTLKSRVFEMASGEGVMTFSGTLFKTSVLLAVLMASAAVGWVIHNPIVMLIGIFGGLGLAVTTAFKPQWSPVTAPLYAILQGLAVGGISLYYAQSMADTKYAGAVPLAILGTMVVFAVMLLLYATRIIKVTQTFLTVVMAGTIAIGITYLITMIGGMFLPALHQLPIYRSGPIGIGFSVFVILLAAANLAVDFKIIEDGVGNKAPKFMEWYAGFGLLVTLVWLYLEILRLLSKLAGRR